MFDENDATRTGLGKITTRLFRSADNPNELLALFEWDNLENARRFAQSEDLRKAMERAGVVERPELTFFDEVALPYK